MSKILLLVFILSSTREASTFSEVSLIGKNATQSETWSDRIANLAIDGNVNTWSVAASPLNSTALGWWEVDLGDDYQVSQVSITASYEDYNANYLQNFSIWLLSNNRNPYLCYEYSSSVSIPPNQSQTFSCPVNSFSTRFVRISRNGGPFRSDGLALAEVKVFVGQPAEQGVGNATKVPLQNSEWNEIDTSNMITSHCNTWQSQFSYLAIDNNVSTYSVCCLICETKNESGPGWWKIDFGSERPIAGVEITSSIDEYNANFLREITIALTSTNTTDLREARICYDVVEEVYIDPNQTLTFKCDVSPTWGRYLLIERRASANFRPDAISIADIKIFETNPSPKTSTIASNATTSVTNQPNVNSTTKAPSRIYLDEVGGYELTPNGMNTSQCATWGDHNSSLAIDGNDSTWSISCLACNGTASSGTGCWLIDFGTERPIVAVKITSSPDQYNSNYLQDIVIALTSINTTDITNGRICYDFQNSSWIPSGTTLTFRCNTQPTWGRYLIVQRKPTASFRPDAFGMAEIKFFESASSQTPPAVINNGTTQASQHPVNPTTPKKVYLDEVGGYEVPTSGMNTDQCTTWGLHYPSLAIDGDYSTWSISCLACDGTAYSGIGCWQIDFGTERPIVAVKITSSPDQYNSNYLQDIVIALTSTNTTDITNGRICYDFQNSSWIPSGTTLTFRCNTQPTWGRYLIIERKPTASFRPDAFGMAEIKFFESGSSGTPPAIINNGTTQRPQSTSKQTSAFH